MEYRLGMCLRYEAKYFEYLSWITELDLELTNLCHLSDVTLTEKSFRLAEIKMQAEDKAPSLEELKNLASELLDFLERDQERVEVQSQMENLLSLSLIIFETISKNTNQVIIVNNQIVFKISKRSYLWPFLSLFYFLLNFIL